MNLRDIIEVVYAMTAVLLSKCAFENKVGAADMTPDLNNICLIKSLYQFDVQVTVYRDKFLY